MKLRKMYHKICVYKVGSVTGEFITDINFWIYMSGKIAIFCMLLHGAYIPCLYVCVCDL